MSNEDPFIWRNSRGWHLLMHSMMGPMADTRGIHGFSEDGLRWMLLPDNMWPTTVQWTNASNTTFYRRQAPTLYFDDEGVPVMLQTAVDHLTAPNSSVEHPEGGCWWGTGWTYASQLPISLMLCAHPP